MKVNAEKMVPSFSHKEKFWRIQSRRLSLKHCKLLRIQDYKGYLWLAHNGPHAIFPAGGGRTSVQSPELECCP